jgi:5-(carboxyamino)imidazole ribonucleotide synthase
MHLRAVASLPLQKPEMLPGSAVMINLLGYEHSRQDYLEKRQKIAAIPQAHLHWYSKPESRPGRKLGHVTVLLDAKTREQEQFSFIIEQVESIWYE